MPGERGRILHVDVLSILFGLGTWLCVNGLWVELPLLVQTLPEGWNLPSYLSVVVQLANVGPLTYTLLNSFFPKTVTEKRSIYFVMGIGLITTILLGLFWDKTTFIAKEDHSTALLVLVFFLASVDCSSRVLYLPFMAKFQETYLSSYFVGEGLSGFVPSIVSLIQGVGGNPQCQNKTDGGEGTEAINHKPLFPVEVFFYFLFACTLLSTVAFYLLNKESVVRQALIPGFNSSTSRHSNSEVSSTESRNNSVTRDVSVFELPSCDNNNLNENLQQGEGSREPSISRFEGSSLLGMSRSQFINLLLLQILVCFFANGFLPSVQSYSALPYGNVTYHLAVTLSNIANPAVCFLYFVIPAPNKKSVFGGAFLSLCVTSYALLTAFQSPTPPLVGKPSGEALLVLTWVVLVALFTYVKVSIAAMVRDSRGKAGLFWYGTVTQVGSTFGAIVSFCLVNYTGAFTSYYPCE